MNKLGMKIVTIVTLITITSMVLLTLTNYFVFNSMFSDLQVDAKNIAAESISSIDGDKLEKVIDNKSMESTEYKELQYSMMEFKSDNDIKYFYTLAKKDEDKAYIVVDASLVDPSPLGEEYDLEDEMTEALNGNISFTKKPVEDEYGIFISAYAPIKNSSGEIIALAGADKDVTSFIHVRTILSNAIITVSVVLIILAVLMSIVFSKKISSGVKSLTVGLNYMSDGDLTVPINVNTNDEIETIADSVNNVRLKTSNTLGVLMQSCENVIERIDNLSAVSQEMAASSEEVAAMIQEVAKGTNSQSEEMAKIDDIMNNFGTKIDETARVNDTVTIKVEEINSKAQMSNQDLTLLENAIKNINSSFTDVNNEIKELSIYLSQIGDVTNIINNVAQQTHILALNASIEAARAGDAGRGFAVVANEVRTLAEQSKNSVSNISGLLENVTAKSNLVMKTSDNMERKLNEQIAVISNSINSFKEIIDNIEEIIPAIETVSNNVNDINNEKENIIKSVEATAAVAEEVSSSSEQIAESMQLLSSSSQEVASSAQDLEKLSENMMNSMKYFKI